MKRVILRKGFILSLCITFILFGITSFAESEGFIDVKVNAPESFTHSIMINLIDGAGINYVITAESVNDWKSNYPLPTGEYLVDYVSFDVNDNSYKVIYPDALSISENTGSPFPIKIENVKSQTLEGGTEQTSQEEDQSTLQEKISLKQSALRLLKSIFLDNSITMTAIIAILIYLIKKRRERIHGEEH